MSSEKRSINESFLVVIAILFIALVLHHLFFFDFYGESLPVDEKIISNLRGFLAKNILIIRIIFILIIISSTFLNARPSKPDSKPKNIFALATFALISNFAFLKGYQNNNIYNEFFYPFFFLASSIFTIMTINTYAVNQKGQVGKLFAKTRKLKQFTFVFKTALGKLFINKPEYGVYIEGGAGAGKSVLIQNFLHQACMNGYAGVLYDYEGDCREKDGAALSRTVLSALKKYNSGKRPYGRIGFAYINYGDPSRTVRVNPISPRYMESSLDVSEFAKTLMTNLEPEWLKKSDFWAGNAINYAYGIMMRLYNDPNLHKYMTIGHVAMICTYDYEAVFKWILADKSLERHIMPLYVAYKENAQSQIAGAVSSAALPITKLLQPDILYPLTPQTDEETFNLDITNEEHPVFLTIGTVPKNKHVLGPVCSLILLVCMNNMNRFNKRRSLFVVDELPTLFIPNLDNLPATARKKDVSTILAAQSFKQMEQAYGKDKAEITRDNLSNQFIGKTRNNASAERIVKYFGKTDLYKTNLSSSDSGDSVSFNTTRQDRLESDAVLNQPIGHFTGVLPEGQPPYFHAQFDNFEPPLDTIPFFSKKWNTGDGYLDETLMKTEVTENYYRVEKEADDLLAPFTTKSKSKRIHKPTP